MIRDLRLPIPAAMIEYHRVTGSPFALGLNSERRLPARIHAWLLENGDGIEIIDQDNHLSMRFPDDAFAALFWLHFCDDFLSARSVERANAQEDVDDWQEQIDSTPETVCPIAVSELARCQAELGRWS